MSNGAFFFVFVEQGRRKYFDGDGFPRCGTSMMIFAGLATEILRLLEIERNGIFRAKTGECVVQHKIHIF